jgi:hypothetical protein
MSYMKLLILTFIVFTLLPSQSWSNSSENEKAYCPRPDVALQKFEDIKKIQNEKKTAECISTYKDLPDLCEGITPIEMLAIKNYTGSYYSKINKSIWMNNKKCEGVISAINQGLAKIPNYKGWVYRGSNLPQQVRDEHQVGNEIIYKAFTSTSNSIGWGGNDQFLIYSETGSSVDSISSLKGEKEVLFSSSTKFKVIHKVKIQETNLYIMIEVDESISKEQRLKKQQKLSRSIQEKIREMIKKDKNHMSYRNFFNYSELAVDQNWECKKNE